MQEAIRTGVTTEPTLRAIFLSEQINRRNAGPLVKPWELDDVPDEFLIGYQAIFSQVKRTQQQNKFESVFRDARRRHPSYRKYVN